MIETTLINTSKITPSVSLIIPTDKNFPHYLTDEKRLKSLLKKAENELVEKFSEDQTNSVIDKLEKLISSIDHKRLSKSIVLFASPEKEKLMYLPFSIEEKIIVDSSFEVRDLFYSIKRNIGYMVVLIDSHQPAVYYGYNSVLVKAKIDDLPSGIEDFERDYPTKVSNFSDAHALKEINLDKYLREIDHVITNLLVETNVPVIICGVDRSIGHFKKLTKNAKNIANYITGNYHNSSIEEIYNAIEVFFFEKSEEEQKKIMNVLEQARNSKQFVLGIEDVWRAVNENKGAKLIVEKDYVCKAILGDDKYTLITEGIDGNDERVIQDAVDDVIELVLENGGEVAFANNGKLEDYKKIALVTYY